MQAAQPSGAGGRARRSGAARRSRAMPATQSAASTWPRSVSTPPADADGEAGMPTLPPREPARRGNLAPPPRRPPGPRRPPRPPRHVPPCRTSSPSPSPIASSASGGSSHGQRHAPVALTAPARPGPLSGPFVPGSPSAPAVSDRSSASSPGSSAVPVSGRELPCIPPAQPDPSRGPQHGSAGQDDAERDHDFHPRQASPLRRVHQQRVPGRRHVGGKPARTSAPSTIVTPVTASPRPLPRSLISLTLAR